MGAIAYTVTATFQEAATRDAYIAWLEDGHIDAVVHGGAHSAMIVKLLEPALQVETRYIFSTRDVFDRYLADSAPALRADGLRLFPPGRGVAFDRRVGEIV